MINIKPLNLFYQEPDLDRWFKYDRYPRKIFRRLIRGKQKPGGVMIVALNLMAGLDQLKIPYRLNDYKYIRKHPEELACIIGKPQLLFEKEWKNPILFGAGIFSHPVECPDLFEKYPQVKHLLVPGEWMRKMFEPYYAEQVSAWPTGIDTNKWKPAADGQVFDFLIYNKIRWNYNHFEETLLKPIKQSLDNNYISYHTIRYGNYTPKELAAKLKISKAVIFLCEHETQGIAYQQILSCNIPVLAWDRGGFWKDPFYFPHKIKYQPVSSVPYWDERCGLKFKDHSEFEPQVNTFLELLKSNQFSPRQYILENLSLEICAQRYLDIYNRVLEELNLQIHQV